MGYSGNYGADEKRRRDLLSKPKYFNKNFEKGNSKRSAIPHLGTKATPEQLEKLRKKLKKERQKRVVVSIITLLISLSILYLLWSWI